MTQLQSIINDPASTTHRATVNALENILNQPLPVLDHGFIRVIDYMGDDSAIVQAARVSYGKGTKQVNQDQGLINYLMRHHHTTPFEMCEIKLHVKLPMFVARQWIRHRTANVNEYSARYSILDKEFYIPEPEHLAEQSTINNQGRGDTLESIRAAQIIKELKEEALGCYELYEKLLGNESEPGIARELARMVLPVNFYTQWYWKIDLHNLLHFTRLRADSHAQYEIRAYAEVLLDIIQKWVPLTYNAFKNYRLDAVNLSGQAWQVVKRMIEGQTVSQEDSGLTAREWRELQEVISR